MKKLIAAAIIIASVSPAFADGIFEDNSRPYKDSWGNSYKYESNMSKDSDGDGVINRYDYRDNDARVQTKSQADYTPRKYKSRGW